MLFGSPRLESNTGVVLPFTHGQKNVSLLTVCIQEYAANHETDESNSGVRPGSPGLHAAEVHKWCMNLLANTTICAESCEKKHWNFKALHNPALYIHCKFFVHNDFIFQLTRPIAYMKLVQCNYTALSKCWKIAGKSLHLINHLFHQFKEVSNALVKTYFTRITLTAFTMKINWSYQ